MKIFVKCLPPLEKFLRAPLTTDGSCRIELCWL